MTLSASARQLSNEAFGLQQTPPVQLCLRLFVAAAAQRAVVQLFSPRQAGLSNQQCAMPVAIQDSIGFRNMCV